MLLLNFAHLLTAAYLSQLAQYLTVAETVRVMDIPTQLDTREQFALQVLVLLVSIGLTPEQWQTEPLLVNLPSLNYAAACMLAELHGRMGHFPAIVRLRKVADSLPAVRETVRTLR